MKQAPVLIAYPYFNKALLDEWRRRRNLRVLIDSGAFTAWKSGNPIDLDKYCRFIETLPLKPWRYFNLDVIGDAEASMRNYETMRSRGLDPIPVFTRGEDPAALERYYETSDYVGVGGLVGTKNNRAYVNGIMKHVAGRKVHLLGFSQQDFIKHHKPFSCDVSSLIFCERMGTLYLYMGGGRMDYSLTRRKFLANGVRPEHKAALSRIGIEAERFLRAENWKSTAIVASARSYAVYTNELEDQMGVLLFAAIGGRVDIMRLFCDAYDAYRDDPKGAFAIGRPMPQVGAKK